MTQDTIIKYQGLQLPVVHSCRTVLISIVFLYRSVYCYWLGYILGPERLMYLAIERKNEHNQTNSKIMNVRFLRTGYFNRISSWRRNFCFVFFDFEKKYMNILIRNTRRWPILPIHIIFPSKLSVYFFNRSLILTGCYLFQTWDKDLYNYVCIIPRHSLLLL